jgi:hypothetical protein
MSLLDLADDLNKAADSKRKALEEAEKQKLSHLRKVSYYKEFGNKWFSELAGEIGALSDSFNKTAGEQAILKSHLDSDSGIDLIAIELIAQNAHVVSTDAHCSVAQKHDDLKVAIQITKQTNTSHLDCDVKITDFKEFTVQVILKHQKGEIDETATDRYCDINDEHFFPIFKTITTEEKKLFKTGEFAEFVLTHFVKTVRETRRV